MRINSKIIINLDSEQIVERDSFEYSGPIVGCISGSGSRSKTKSKSQSTSESGTNYNEDFLKRASAFASGTPDTSSTNFDAQAYLKAHPDVAADPNYGRDPYQHYLDFGKNDPSGNYTFTPKNANSSPTYNPAFVQGKYTSLAPGGFDKLESSLYDTQASKLKQAYDTGVAGQREELAQMGALNSPSQFLEGSARSSLDRSYIQNLQQAARDAALERLGAEQTEAGRRTAFDTGEATRQTGFNEDTAKALLQTWLQKLGLAIESGRYSKGQSTGQSSGSTVSGSGGIFKFGGD